MQIEDFISYASNKDIPSKGPYRTDDHTTLELFTKTQDGYSLQLNIVFSTKTRIPNMKIREINDELEKFPKFLIKYVIRIENYDFTLLPGYWFGYDVLKLSIAGKGHLIRDCLLHVHSSFGQLIKDVKRMHTEYEKAPNEWIKKNTPRKSKSLHACLNISKDNSLIIIDKNEYQSRFQEDPPQNFVPFSLGLLPIDSDTTRIIVILLEETKKAYQGKSTVKSRYFDIENNMDFTYILEKTVDKLFLRESFEGSGNTTRDEEGLMIVQTQGSRKDFYDVTPDLVSKPLALPSRPQESRVTKQSYQREEILTGHRQSDNLYLSNSALQRDTVFNSGLSRSDLLVTEKPLEIRAEESKSLHLSGAEALKQGVNNFQGVAARLNRDQRKVIEEIKQESNRKCIENMDKSEVISEVERQMIDISCVKNEGKDKLEHNPSIKPVIALGESIDQSDRFNVPFEEGNISLSKYY